MLVWIIVPQPLGTKYTNSMQKYCANPRIPISENIVCTQNLCTDLTQKVTNVELFTVEMYERSSILTVNKDNSVDNYILVVVHSVKYAVACKVVKSYSLD